MVGIDQSTEGALEEFEARLVAGSPTDPSLCLLVHLFQLLFGDSPYHVDHLEKFRAHLLFPFGPELCLTSLYRFGIMSKLPRKSAEQVDLLKDPV